MSFRFLKLSMSIEISVHTDLETAWERFVPVKLDDVFTTAKGPIPPVVGVSDQTGRWDVVGRTRTIRLGDGSKAQEEITLSEPSDGQKPENGVARFGYIVSGFTSPLRILTKQARGYWMFTEKDGHTKIEWTYSFIPAGLLARPFLALLIATFWRAYMTDGLNNMAQELSNSAD